MLKERVSEHSFQVIYHRMALVESLVESRVMRQRELSSSGTGRDVATHTQFLHISS